MFRVYKINGRAVVLSPDQQKHMPFEVLKRDFILNEAVSKEEAFAYAKGWNDHVEKEPARK